MKNWKSNWREGWYQENFFFRLEGVHYKMVYTIKIMNYKVEVYKKRAQ